MAIVALTTDQRVNLEGNARFQNLVRMAIYNQANYWVGLDGSSVPGNDRIRWAKSRLLSAGIINNPTAIDFQSYLKQFVIKLKDIPVFDNANSYDEDAVLNYMLANSKFDELADNVFNLRIQRIEF